MQFNRHLFKETRMFPVQNAVHASATPTDSSGAPGDTGDQGVFALRGPVDLRTTPDFEWVPDLRPPQQNLGELLRSMTNVLMAYDVDLGPASFHGEH